MKNNWLGLMPSALAMFLQAATASSRFAFSVCVRVTMAFRFLTAASASPFDSGLCAEASSCYNELSLQKLVNSCRNWGPPSVIKDLGQPKELKTFDSSAVIFAVCVLVRGVSHA